jgi:hypothetical protein
MQNNDLQLLEILFSQNGVCILKDSSGTEVIGLRHPIRGVDTIESEAQQDDHSMIYSIQLESIALDSKLLIDLPEDISCRFHEKAETKFSEPIDNGKPSTSERISFTSIEAPLVEEPEEPDVNDYLYALFDLYEWTMEKTGSMYIGEIFGSMVQGVLYATIDYTKTKTNEQRDKVVTLLLGEIGRDPTTVLQLLDDEYSHRVLDCVTQILYYSIPKPESEIEKAGLRKLLEKAYEYARNFQMDAILATINHYKQILDEMDIKLIERLFNSTSDYGYPPFVFIDVVEQVIIFSKATTDWMIGPHLSVVGFQIDSNPEPIGRNEWSDAIRELIMIGLHLASKVVSESIDCLAATVGSIILGNRTSIWIQRFMEWESSNFYDGDTGLSDAYQHYFSKVHGLLFPKPDVNEMQLIESSDDRWTLQALHTLHQGFDLNDFQESAIIVNEYISKQSLGQPSDTKSSTDIVEEHKILREKVIQDALDEISEYQERLFEELPELIRKHGVPNTLKIIGNNFWRERISHYTLTKLRSKFVNALTSAALLATLGNFMFAILLCIRAAEEELHIILHAFRDTYQSTEYGNPPSEKTFADTYKELERFIMGGKMNLRAMAFILYRIERKEMSDLGPNLFTYFTDFVRKKDNDHVKKLRRVGEVLFSKIYGTELIDLRNAGAHTGHKGIKFDERMWDLFLDRFNHIIVSLTIIQEFEVKVKDFSN